MGEILTGCMSPTITEPSPVQQNVSAAHDRLAGAVQAVCSERYKVLAKYVTKGVRDGWEAETIIGLRDDLILAVYTSKRHGGALSTSATVYTTGDGFKTHEMYKDYSQRISSERVRVTEKAVRAHHEAALATVFDICLPAIIQQYHLEDSNA